MNPRHVPPRRVRPERTVTRSALWANAPMQLTLPFEHTGLSERISATGRLRATPDYDIFAWLCERWLIKPTPTGWMRPTFYEIGNALYAGRSKDGAPIVPGGEDYATIRESLDRLAGVLITIDGYDPERNELDDRIVTKTSLVEIGRPKDEVTGERRFQVRLQEWLRVSLEHERVAQVPWRVLRAFDRNQALAKRLWVYLAAERFEGVGAGEFEEQTTILLDDRVFGAWGMKAERPDRQKRAAVLQAATAIAQVDPRYTIPQSFEIQHLTQRRGRLAPGWWLIVTRLAWQAHKDRSGADAYSPLDRSPEAQAARAAARRALGL